MKLKRILSVVLLLSICIGALVSCAVSATEPNEQPNAPAAPNKTEPLNGDEVKISTDPIVGEKWRALMSGDTRVKDIYYYEERKVGYTMQSVRVAFDSPIAIDNILNMIKELDNVVEKRISWDWQDLRKLPSRGLTSFTIGTAIYSGNIRQGIQIIICEKHIYFGGACFEIKEDLEPWVEKLRTYFDQLEENPYEGIASNYKMGQTWMKHVTKDAALSQMEIGFRVDTKYGLDTNWTGTNILDEDLKKEVVDVLRCLDSITVEEADFCSCCVEDYWTPSDLGFAYVKVYDEDGYCVLTVNIYREGLHIVNEQTHLEICITTSLEKSNYEQCKRLKEIVAAQAQINRELDYEKRREQ